MQFDGLAFYTNEFKTRVLSFKAVFFNKIK